MSKIKLSGMVGDPSVVRENFMKLRDAIEALGSEVYDYVPPEATDGIRLVFTITGGYQTGSVRVRLNGLGLDPIIEFVEQSGDEILLAYAPEATEKIHIDFTKL